MEMFLAIFGVYVSDDVRKKQITQLIIQIKLYPRSVQRDICFSYS